MFAPTRRLNRHTIWFIVTIALVALALVGVLMGMYGDFSDVTYVAWFERNRFELSPRIPPIIVA